MNSIVLILVSAIVVVATGFRVDADDSTSRMIAFERQVLNFRPSRADLSVGIVWLSVLTPDNDWTVTLPNPERTNFQDVGTLKYVELKQTGTNRFELPPLKIEPRKKDSGPICVSIKAWFNEVSSEYESLYWVDVADRYGLLTFCTRDDPRIRARFTRNRVATLNEFHTDLDKPFVLNLRRDVVPWRPGLFVDDQGALYFHSLLVGRHTEGTLSHHVLDAWKLGPDRKLERIPLPSEVRRPTWGDRVREMVQHPFEALIRIASNDVVVRDGSGILYARSDVRSTTACRRDGSPPLNELVRIDSNGECHHVVASSFDQHTAGMARQAFFYNITALAVGSGANLYVADGDLDSGSWVRRVKPDGTVSTLAGSDKVGFSDGKGDAARFYLPSGLAADENGNVYVADPVNSSVRKVTPDGVVTTISAKLNDPTHVEAFLQPSGVAVSRNGALYVLDGGPQMARVSMISPDGKVETLAIVDAKSRKRPN